ncbi:aspartic peptidase domain-containing protein [Aspergillus multicolor]|uniref:pepsin-like aspartic protease n=1 Tax=Aspergillus multicolor TaxID=41759 RepID=UPI003CCD05FC
MRGLFIFWLAAFAAEGLCSLFLHESDSPHVLRLGLQRNKHNDPIGRDRRRFKRQADVVDADLYGESMGGDIYSTNITIGDPPQWVTVSVDTGSADLWVVSSENPVCDVRGTRCDEFGLYNPNSSTSYVALSDEFGISYGDRSWAEGHYAIDTISIENADIPGVQFAVATSSSIDKGILGIGYSTNVVADYRYPNLPELLVSDNITRSNAYSLWLNRLGSNEGSILFGGINTAHYTGTLQTIPVVQYMGDYIHLWLTLTEMGVESASDNIDKSYTDTRSTTGAAEFPLVALLDSGATLTYLPSNVVAQIFSDLDVHFYQQGQFGYVPCDTYLVSREDYNLTFTFSGVTIRVPLSELVLHDAISGPGRNALPLPDTDSDEESCLFGILPAVDFFPILGDTFLRSAYAVFDLENNEISLAQANRNPGDDRILEIGEGSDGVPEAEDVSNPVTTATVALGGSSLVLPAGWTNEPVFPSRAVTTSSSATAPRTSDEDAEETGDGLTSGSGSGSGTATSAGIDAPTETDGAIQLAVSKNPWLLIPAVVIGLVAVP